MKVDYQAFFEELRACYLENGMAFSHEWPLRAYLMTKNTTSCYSVPKKKPASNNMPKEGWVLYSSNKKSINSPITSGYRLNNKAPSSCDFVFKRDQREVYTIALELARKIGMLPDNLHNRMLLATDRHPAILAYLDEFGA